jgi:hypothetical protein
VAFILLLQGFGRAARTHLFRLITVKKRKKALRAPRPSQLRYSTPNANIKTWKNNQ